MGLYVKLIAGVGTLVLVLLWLAAHPYRGEPLPSRSLAQSAERHDDLVHWNGWW